MLRMPGFVSLERLCRRYLHSPTRSDRRHFPEGADRDAVDLESTVPVLHSVWICMWTFAGRVSGEGGGMAESAPSGDGWSLFQDILKANVTPITWQTWLRPLRSGDTSQDAVTVLAPTDFHLRWLIEKYGDLLEEAAVRQLRTGRGTPPRGRPGVTANCWTWTSTRPLTSTTRLSSHQRSTAMARHGQRLPAGGQVPLRELRRRALQSLCPCGQHGGGGAAG